MQDAVAMHSSLRKFGELTSSAGVLMSMGSITVNSFFTFLTVAQGLRSLAFTQ